jgi:polyisoprenyl-phosphate glycosyltransferase
MKTISLVSGTFNEVENVEELFRRVWAALQPFQGKYEFEYIVIDNDSPDGTQELLRKLAMADKRIKVILNRRNFGHVRSPLHALFQARGDAVIMLASDLQDPPELIPQFIEQWEKGSKLALGVKNQSEESPLFFLVRKAYYELVSRLSQVKLLKNVTGFGLYDRQVIELLRGMEDPYPYVRGIICDFGFPVAQIPFVQPARKRGFTKNNLYTLYDLAMLGITSFSKIPLRLATMLGFGASIMSFLVGLGYLLYKLVFWQNFSVGIAPVVVGVFFLGSLQLFFIGILGEYIGAIHTRVHKRPLVVEKERVNFEAMDNRINRLEYMPELAEALPPQERASAALRRVMGEMRTRLRRRGADVPSLANELPAVHRAELDAPAPPLNCRNAAPPPPAQ